MPTDAVIIRESNIFVYLCFADCIPFTLYDKKQKIMAFAHLGWQIIELKLQTKLLKIFLNEYKSNIEDLIIYLGPSIKYKSYILENPLQLKYDDWKPFLHKLSGDKYQIDLNGYIINCLKHEGLKEEQINIDKVDTAKNNNFFSHYRCVYINKEGEEGRFIYGAGMIDYLSSIVFLFL
ncbi:MAG: polyphenol oxidase family protein [Bacilli bacterium]|nr:polyphenol oxidase family protein [Bacilli bacterium]